MSRTDTARRYYDVQGMDCPDCARKVTDAIRGIPGVDDVQVDFMGGQLEFTCSDDVHRSGRISKAVERAGYHASPRRANATGSDDDAPTTRLRWILALAAALPWLAGMGAALLGRPTISVVAYWTTILVGGVPIARNAIQSLRRGRVTVDVLMTIAVIGAIGLAEHAEASAVVVLFSGSELLEAYSIGRTRNAIKALLAAVPSIITLRRDGDLVDVGVEEAALGETQVIRPGARVALDGLALNSALVNEAPITGESRPVEKEIGDPVYAGSVNDMAPFEATVTRTSDDTELARILRLVRQAQRDRANTERFVDRFAQFYAPAILIAAALLVAVPVILFNAPFSDWLYRGLVILVIGCPCALVLSTPVTMVSALARGASMGILVKGGIHLETLASARVVAFDKTGTLTQGNMELTDVASADDVDPATALATAASVLSRSEHAIGHAIVEAARRVEAKPVPAASDHMAYPGRGASATIDGAQYVVGSARLFDDLGIPRESLNAHTESLASQGKTATLLGTMDRALACFGLSDRVRDEATATVEAVRRLGIRRVVMLTGDHESVAAQVHSKTGVDAHHAGLLPQEKLEHILRLESKFGPVAMVGDGINDAPALAGATIGIAMGGIGAEAAIEQGDVVLIGDDLRKLPHALGLAKAALLKVKVNIAFAVVTKLLILVLAAMDLATLWAAVLADVGVSLAVIINGMRMLRWQPKAGPQNGG